MKIVPLANDAEQKSYYKYIQEPLIEPTAAEIQHAKTFRGEVADGLPFSKHADVQFPDFEIRPEGVYYLPDQSLYMSFTKQTPNITEDMSNWWMIWHQFAQLRYALWNPEDHYNVQLSDQDKVRFLDKNLPMNQRIWGTSSEVTESFNGEKPTTSVLNFVEPNAVGLRDDLLGTDGSMSIVIANNTIKAGPITIPVFMVENLRKNSTGNTVWNVNAWVGHGYKNGQPVAVKLPFRNKIAENVGMLIIHSHKEITHLNTILPKIYEEYSQLPLDFDK